ncbi:MAG: fumarylacetoacetate hydrolase family protein [Eubacteriaceae bacterium]|nr:fumarylacetoacetate hydrolase family protein [Eubacteriaceae bacterium]
MQFITYQADGLPEGGVLTDHRNKVIPFYTLSKILGIPLPGQLPEFIAMAGTDIVQAIRTVLKANPETGLDRKKITLLAPLLYPRRNLFCLGKNYRDHVSEIKNMPDLEGLPQAPIYFSKLPSTVIGPDEPIHSHPGVTKQLDYEGELAVIIGLKGSDISKTEAEKHIFGYTIANDLTARDLQHRHSQWLKGKSLDTFCPMGPGIVHKTDLPLPLDVGIRCLVNGETRQQSSTRHMIFDIPEIIHDLSQGITLLPGDIILTGTPAGVGMAMDPPCFLKKGDTVTVEIDGIGSLTNPVV